MYVIRNVLTITRKHGPRNAALFLRFRIALEAEVLSVSLYTTVRSFAVHCEESGYPESFKILKTEHKSRRFQGFMAGGQASNSRPLSRQSDRVK